MKFLNPAGLWLLLGIPLLILYYLIRPQHEDRSVSSTFLWKLSSRFMKKRLPAQRVRKILTFLLQLFIVVAVALLAAKPAIVSEKSCDYIAIIDTSASMQTADDTGKTRFAGALEAVEELSAKAERGHTVSVMLAGDTASWLIQKSTSRKDIQLALGGATCTYGSCDVQQALSLARQVSQDSANPQILFYTDNTYEESTNLQVIDLNQNQWNVSVSNVTGQDALMGIAFSCELVSYNRDALLTVGLRIDGIVSDVQKVRCEKDTPITVTCTAEEVTAYDIAEIFVEAEDGLQADNSYALCRPRQRTCNVLLISQSPLYLESALKALGNCNVTVVQSAQDTLPGGQDLYVFDGVAPKSYPKDGSVLVFGTQMLPEGLQAADTVSRETTPQMDPDLNSSLYDGLSLKETVITKYTPLRGNLTWQDVLYCDGAPIIATRDMGNGLQFTVVSFDLHDSNLPMQTDFLVLMKNLVEFSVPDFLRNRDYTVGSTVSFSVMPDTKELYVAYPDGTVRTLQPASGATGITPETAGIYTAAMTVGDQGEYADFFVHIASEETKTNRYQSLSVELPPVDNAQKEDAINEIWFWVALGLLVLVLTEWGWYYREQY